MTKKQIQKMTQKRKYKTIKSGIVSTLITALIFSVFCLVIITRLQKIDDQYQPPIVNSVLDGQKRACIGQDGVFYHDYLQSKGYVSSCFVDGRFVDFE